EISADGNYIAFESRAFNLGSGFSNPSSTQNVFVYTRGPGMIALASHTALTTTCGNNLTFGKDVSADGRYIVFQSYSSDLGNGLTDTNSNSDVFLYDRVSTNVTLVSHTSILTSTANGTSDGSAVSRDGSTVAFRSSAPDLGSGFTD